MSPATSQWSSSSWSLPGSSHQSSGLSMSPSTSSLVSICLHLQAPQSLLISSNQSSGLHSSPVTGLMVSLYLQPLVLVVSPCFEPNNPLVSPCFQLPSLGLWLSPAISPLVSPCL
jgi:hypothetical protein